MKELVEDLRLAGDDGLRKVEEAGEALEKMLQRAENLEKRVQRRVDQLEKNREKLEKGLAGTIEKLVKPGKKKASPGKAAPAPSAVLRALAQPPADPAPLPEEEAEAPPSPARPRDRVLELAQGGLSGNRGGHRAADRGSGIDPQPEAPQIRILTQDPPVGDDVQ